MKISTLIVTLYCLSLFLCSKSLHLSYSIIRAQLGNHLLQKACFVSALPEQLFPESFPALLPPGRVEDMSTCGSPEC